MYYLLWSLRSIRRETFNSFRQHPALRLLGSDRSAGRSGDGPVSREALLARSYRGSAGWLGLLTDSYSGMTWQQHTVKLVPGESRLFQE